MKSSLAIVFGFSEPCIPLAKQLILSSYKSLITSKVNVDVTYFPYTCNYSIINKSGTSFNTDAFDDLGHLNISVQNCDFTWNSLLPDISIYDHFTNIYMDQYDYVLYCHDDIHFRNSSHFDTVIRTLDDNRYNIVADLSLTCNHDISVRFLPGLIFVKTNKFRAAHLSFCNDLHIFSKSMKNYPIERDGGAGLLASYYSQDNKIEAMPCYPYKYWFQHMRIDSDYGIEMHNLLFPGTSEFNEVIQWANKYIDRQLYA